MFVHGYRLGCLWWRRTWWPPSSGLLWITSVTETHRDASNLIATQPSKPSSLVESRASLETWSENWFWTYYRYHYSSFSSLTSCFVCRYILISPPFEWSDQLRLKFVEGFDAFLDLLKCMQVTWTHSKMFTSSGAGMRVSELVCLSVLGYGPSGKTSGPAHWNGAWVGGSIHTSDETDSHHIHDSGVVLHWRKPQVSNLLHHMSYIFHNVVCITQLCMRYTASYCYTASDVCNIIRLKTVSYMLHR